MATLETTPAAPLERGRQLAPAAALLAVTLWASAFVGIRSAGHSLSPGSLALGRLLVASAALGALALARRERLPARRDLRGIALCGVLWFALYSVVLNAAERRVDAGTAAMLVNVGPILIALLAGVLLREGFPRSLLAGCAIAFAGAVVIGAATSKTGLAPSWGAVLCLVAALAYAGGVIAQKPLLERVSPLQVTWLACTAGAVACLPFARSLWHDASAAPASALAWTVYLGVVPTGIGFIAWAYALSRTTAGRMGSTTYLVTPIAIGLGWLILGETPPALALLGGTLCLAGVAVARRRG
jgi:drug/metabolite transporter (DMT)-like permease